MVGGGGMQAIAETFTTQTKIVLALMLTTLSISSVKCKLRSRKDDFPSEGGNSAGRKINTIQTTH